MTLLNQHDKMYSISPEDKSLHFVLCLPYIGVATSGALTGARAPSTSSDIFSLLRSLTKSITANSIWFFIPYSFQKGVNWQREAFYDATESNKIVFGRPAPR